MSIDTGNGHRAYCGPDLNETYNVSGMYFKAFRGTGIGGGEGIRDLDGKLASECVEPLRTAIRRMEDEPAVYEALNPENGWGSAQGALQTLRALLEGCVEHPLATVDVH